MRLVRGKDMDFKDTMKSLISFRISEMNYLLGGYTEILPDIGCKEVISDLKQAQDSLGAAICKFRIHELLPEGKDGK